MPRTTAAEQATRIAFGAGAAFAAAILSFFAFGLLGVGAGLVAGTTAYVVLGLLQADGPACGGTGCT